MSIEEEIREEFDAILNQDGRSRSGFALFEDGYRACYERHVQPPPKAVDLSKVAGPESIIPMEFRDVLASDAMDVRNGFLNRVGNSNLPYYDGASFWRFCRFDTSRPSVCFTHECPLPDGVECQVWLYNMDIWDGTPRPAYEWYWHPGLVYQVTGLLPNWVYPWEVGNE